MDYEAVIGLEIHAQLLTDSKAFCSCTTRFGCRTQYEHLPNLPGNAGGPPGVQQEGPWNTPYVWPWPAIARSTNSAGLPGRTTTTPTFPRTIRSHSMSYRWSEHGWVEIETEQGKKRIGITRIHMEEDAGKLIHDENKPWSYVDLNRTGVPLIEIVSEPDLRSPEEAAAYLRALRSVLVYLQICDGNMEEGSFRCDANVSLRPRGTEPLGVKTELKNMNSFRYVQKGLQYEIERQQESVDRRRNRDSGDPPVRACIRDHGPHAEQRTGS
jgi:aspartyl-tRNA(Asn)/glutamyl-tRNA(Gln) amidotransferase subunit B